MNTNHTDQQHLKDTDEPTGDRAEPKGQDILKTDAEGAGSDASEFAGGSSDSTKNETGNASGSAADEATIGIP